MNEVLTTWRRFLDVFNEACLTDEWDALSPFLTEDADYRVSGFPMACHLHGRDAVIAGFAKSVRGFDRKFDQRHHEPVGIRYAQPDIVSAIAWTRYSKAGLPDVCVAAHGIWQFRDGRISHMSDMWDTTLAENANALAWLSQHGAGFDPAYA
ncbi:nuclear transport factor 2 family protein [Pyruvatibacter mobilis]|uniref:nuclear transport factor 2 family protein n=1 Tax=Pyruvatibacter mobilis TaxID=1712261 RepID=UPI003BAC8C51